MFYIIIILLLKRACMLLYLMYLADRKGPVDQTVSYLHSPVLLAQGHHRQIPEQTGTADPGRLLLRLQQRVSSSAVTNLTQTRRLHVPYKSRSLKSSKTPVCTSPAVCCSGPEPTRKCCHH